MAAPERGRPFALGAQLSLAFRKRHALVWTAAVAAQVADGAGGAGVRQRERGPYLEPLRITQRAGDEAQ